MMKAFVKEGRKFEIHINRFGKVVLSYKGKVGDFAQGCIWVCDDEIEAMDMVDAVIDPNRYADDEYKARHIDEIYSNCKW